jgi:hypothetical protein
MQHFRAGSEPLIVSEFQSKHICLVRGGEKAHARSEFFNMHMTSILKDSTMHHYIRCKEGHQDARLLGPGYIDEIAMICSAR